MLKSRFDSMQVLENISEGCYFLNCDWEFEFINKASEKHIKKTREELIGVCIWELFPNYINTYTYKMFHKAYDEQRPQFFEITSEYSKKQFQIKVLPDINGISVIFSEITNRKVTEAQKQYYDKLKIIGELAAGVAHEVRNPMTTVKGFLQLMAQNKELDAFKSTHNLLIEELDRINGIITEFLDIAKDRPTKLECCNLNELIKTLFPLLETRAIKEDKLVVLKLSNIRDLTIDRNEIRQVLLNMINNALDAMKPGKTVQIITYETNDHVVLSIKYEGTGIPSNIINDIVNPFVTTKEEGTGLGLPICLAIAERNNAKIDYTSSSEGTRFNVIFEAKRSSR